MKKIMKMACVAVMGMMMGVNVAKAVSVAPTNPAEMVVMDDRNSIGERLESRTLLCVEGDKTHKSVYVIGEDGMVKSKTMYRYDDNNDEWTPMCVYRAVYGSENNMIVYAGWNKAAKEYNANVTAATYEKSECPVLIKLPSVLDY